MTTPEIKCGQIWREGDPRKERFVVVEDVRQFGLVYIRTVCKDGNLWTIEHNSRTTRAQPERFNGKRGGYVLHEEASNASL